MTDILSREEWRQALRRLMQLHRNLDSFDAATVEALVPILATLEALAEALNYASRGVQDDGPGHIFDFSAICDSGERDEDAPYETLEALHEKGLL